MRIVPAALSRFHPHSNSPIGQCIVQCVYQLPWYFTSSCVIPVPLKLHPIVQRPNPFDAPHEIFITAHVLRSV